MADLADLRSRIILDTSQVEQGKQRVRQAFAEMGQAVRGLSQAQQEAAARNRAWQQELNNEAAAIRRAAVAKQQAASFERELAATKARLIEITEGEGRAAQSVAQKYSELSRVYRGQLVEVRQQIEAHEALAAAATKAAAAQARALQQARANVGRNLQTVGGALTGAVTTPLAVAGGLSVAAGVQVQGAEATLAAQTGAQGGALQGLDASFRRVAGTVPQTLKETAGAIATLYQRTRETGPALEGLAKTELDLSRITGENLGGQIKATTQAFAAWNITAAAQIPALDVLEKAHQQTGVSVSKLADSLARAAPTLRTWGIGFTEGAALLSSFEKAGIPADRFVQGLTQGIARLSKAGITDLHQALSIIIGDLTNAKNPAAAAAEAVRLFGARAGVQLADAVRTGKINVQALTQTLEHSQGTIDKTAEAAKTFGTRFRQAMNQATVAIAPIGLELLKIGVQALQAFEPIIAVVGRAVEAFSHLSPAGREVTLAIVGLVAAVGPAVVGIGRFIVGIQEIRAAWIGLRAVVVGSEGFAAVTGGLEAIGVTVAGVSVGWIAAFVAMGAAVLAFATNFHGVRDQVMQWTRDLVQRHPGETGPALALHAGWDLITGAGRPGASSGGGDLGPNYHPLYGDVHPAALPGGSTAAGSQSRAAIQAALAGIGQAKAKKTEAQKEDDRATDQLAKNARILQFLHNHESVDVAKLAGDYRELSASRLRELVASQKQVDAAEKTAESHKQYTKDLGILNAQIRRLAAGHDAEASGIDALKEKLPGLTRAQYEAMNGAIQWKKHLEDLRAEAHRVAGEIRGIQTTILEAGAGSNMEEAAARLFGPKLLEQGKKPRNAADLYNKYLTPDQQAQAREEAGKAAFANLDQQLREARRTFNANYGNLIGGGRGTFDRAGQAYRGAAGVNEGNYLSQKQQDELYRKAQETVQEQDRAARVSTTTATYNAAFSKINEVAGQAEPALALLQQQFRNLTSRGTAARETMLTFGVALGALPKETQRLVRAFLDLQHGLQFVQDLGQGVQSVFENVFSNLSHGFKGFFANIIQGFEGMLQQMAAKYLASQVANLFMNLLGPALTGIFGGGHIAGHAAGGPFSAGRPMLVGEYGPELILPSRGGHVVPNAQLAGMGGGGMTVHFHVHGVTDAAGFRQNRGAIMSDLGRAIDRARRTHG